MNSLRYNEVSMKASHNSYQRTERVTEQLDWNPGQPFNCGCGAIELDIAQSGEDGNYWSVSHDQSYNKEVRQLSGFLSDLSVWSKSNPGHDVVTLYLDLKHTAKTSFPHDLDSYLRDRLLADIYSPGQIMGTCSDLSTGVETNGWPTLDKLKNKFIVCVTGDPQGKEAYATTKPGERLCFADKDTKLNETPSDLNRVFFNFHILHDKDKDWMPIFRASAKKKNVITRGWVADNEDNWNDCLASGCNVVATDEVSDNSWAKVGDSRFVKLQPLQ